MNPWRPGWPAGLYLDPNRIYGLGWHYYDGALPPIQAVPLTVPAAHPTVLAVPPTIQPVPPTIQPVASTAQAPHTEQNPRPIAEREHRPPERRVRFADETVAGSGNPIHADRPDQIDRRQSILRHAEVLYKPPSALRSF